MSLLYLLDTNIMSEPLRPHPNVGVLGKLEQHQTEIAISSVVWHELHFGAERLPPSRKRTAIIEYLNSVIGPSIPILPYDDRAAQWHASQRATLEKQGTAPPFVDGQIAAVAKTNHLTLVTNNLADFSRFEGLSIENWFV
ncbi:MAG: type II toxin-antitoxin system VapC family toxin [Chloroflexota bacterium]